MKFLWPLVLLGGLGTGPCMAASIDDTIERGFTQIYMGDVESGLLQLESVARSGPKGLEKLWEYVYDGISYRENDPLEKRVENLNSGTKAVQIVIQLAYRTGHKALGYYISARLAESYNAFDRAIMEIDKAIAHDPGEARYYRAKGLILMKKAKWERDELVIRDALTAFQNGLNMLDHNGSDFTSKGDMYFRMGWSYPQFPDDSHSKIIDFYEMALATGDLGRSNTAYAWNNLSISYRRINECAKAKEAAEKALAIFEFGNAKTNLSYSKSCLEIEKLDVFADSSQSN